MNKTVEDPDHDEVVNGTSRATLRKIWMSLSTVTFLVMVIAFGKTQGAQIDPKIGTPFEIKFSPETPDAVVGMWGVLFMAVLLLLSGPILHEHALRGGRSWRERYAFRLFDAAPSVGVGASAQTLAFIVFSVAPVYSLFHFWDVFLSRGKICASGPDKKLIVVAEGGKNLFKIPEGYSDRPLLGDAFRLAGSFKDGFDCLSTTTFFPVVGPLLLFGLTTFALLVTLRSWIALGGDRYLSD
ncbi:hypothetical protein [uncultured Alsobacter sp.]|uniref:hypothetical protein n=1 Tax=uncultured Alsobacter sp. TaxID=1748258 RepID=UPI0025FA6B3F|nr:hypothetical protein [uncultured Alsobacter sp.]